MKLHDFSSVRCVSKCDITKIIANSALHYVHCTPTRSNRQMCSVKRKWKIRTNLSSKLKCIVGAIIFDIIASNLSHIKFNDIEFHFPKDE